MNTQYVTIEKDPAPMKITAPWRVRCSEGEGPFKAHIVSGFRTKRRATAYAIEMEKLIAQDMMNK